MQISDKMIHDKMSEFQTLLDKMSAQGVDPVLVEWADELSDFLGLIAENGYSPGKSDGEVVELDFGDSGDAA